MSNDRFIDIGYTLLEEIAKLKTNEKNKKNMDKKRKKKKVKMQSEEEKGKKKDFGAVVSNSCSSPIIAHAQLTRIVIRRQQGRI